MREKVQINLTFRWFDLRAVARARSRHTNLSIDWSKVNNSNKNETTKFQYIPQINGHVYVIGNIAHAKGMHFQFCCTKPKKNIQSDNDHLSNWLIVVGPLLKRKKNLFYLSALNWLNLSVCNMPIFFYLFECKVKYKSGRQYRFHSTLNYLHRLEFLFHLSFNRSNVKI